MHQNMHQRRKYIFMLLVGLLALHVPFVQATDRKTFGIMENMKHILTKIDLRQRKQQQSQDSLQTFHASDSNDLLRQVEALHQNGIAYHDSEAESVAEAGQGVGKDLFELPRCNRSPWHRIAIYVSYIAGKLPHIGPYNHVTLVLAPATPELYSKGPNKHPDGAFVYELSGTASEFLLHATVQGQTIAIPRTNRLTNHDLQKKMRFMFIGTANCAKAATTTATTKEHRRWMEWEKNSGLVFQRPWSAIMLKFRELHDTLFKEQRRVGMPFKAAFRALFPIAEEEGIGGANQHRYNFATFNCAHHVRVLLTKAFGMKEKNAERLVISDLTPFGFPAKWHKYEPFSLMNPKTTDMFEMVAHQRSYPRQAGVVDVHGRYRCLKTPVGTPTFENNDVADPFSCLTAWQTIDWEYEGDTGETETVGGYFQFQKENYANVWIEAATDPELRQRLNEKRLTIGGKKAGESESPMGPLVNFKEKAEQ